MWTIYVMTVVCLMVVALCHLAWRAEYRTDRHGTVGMRLMAYMLAVPLTWLWVIFAAS